MATMTMTTTAPAAPNGFCTTNCRSRLQRETRGGACSAAAAPDWDRIAMRASSGVVADAWIDPGVEDVHEQVRQGEDGDHQHDQRLGHVVVLVGDRLHEQRAEPIEIEHLLRDDEPAHQERELDADHGDHG